MDNLDAHVGAEIRSWLGRRGLPQRRLAEVLNITQGNVSQRLRGNRSFTIAELMQIATFLDVSLADLLGSSLVNEKTPRPMGEGSSEGVAVAGLDPATSRL
ncbi:helix-turn-helix domain-containing protein [Nesterenkonia halobia]|uniref:helix-turn-helix domain-containing protein n=1 Tax=Nesterenkonia halobia TaxID=37922 RepID=UPI003CD05A44